MPARKREGDGHERWDLFPRGMETDVARTRQTRRKSRASTAGMYLTIKAEFHYASWFEAGSELVQSWFEAGSS